MVTARRIRTWLSILLTLAVTITGIGMASHRAVHADAHVPNAGAVHGAAVAPGHLAAESNVADEADHADAASGLTHAGDRHSGLPRSGDDAPCASCPLCLALAGFVLASLAYLFFLALFRPHAGASTGLARATSVARRPWPSGGLGSRAPPLFAV